MALNPIARYPGQLVADAAYPYGKAQNISTEGDGTGTPWEKDLVNDVLGMLQALLVAANLTPTGTSDSASVSQYLQAIQWAASSAHATIDPKHPTYGAAGDGVANDTTPLQNAMNAAAALGSGTVDLGGKTYRVTAPLACHSNVNVQNGRIVMDHATSHLLRFDTATGLSTEYKWANVTLDFAQTNTGIIILVSVPSVALVFENCRFNDSGLCTNRLFWNTGGSDVAFEDCDGRIPINGPGFNSDSGVLVVNGGTYSTPLGYADSIVYGTGGTHRLDDVHFVTSATTAGNAICVHVAGQKVIASGCLFDDGTTAKGNKGFFSVLAAGVGDVTETGSIFRNISVPYSFANAMAVGSRVSLLPNATIDIGAAPTATLPTGYANVSVRSTNTTGPVFTMPAILFLGQRLCVTIWNGSGTPWSGVTLIGLFFGGTNGINNSTGRSFEAVATDRNVDGSYEWTIVGPFSEMFP